MKKFTKILSISIFTLSLSGVSLAGEYWDLSNKINAVAELFDSDHTVSEACTSFSEFQKERDEFLISNESSLDRWSPRNLKATQEHERDISHFCNKTQSEKGLVPAREEALKTARYLCEIFNWE